MSAIHWFEIPVGDFDRAKTFYEGLLSTQIHVMDMRETMGSMLGMLPNRGGAGGALVHNAQHGYVPSMSGAMVYLVTDGDLDATLGKVGELGGETLLPKTPLGDAAGGGFTAWIKDTEGNRIGLYSQE